MAYAFCAWSEVDMGDISFTDVPLLFGEIVCYAKNKQYAIVEEHNSGFYYGRGIKIGKKQKSENIA